MEKEHEQGYWIWTEDGYRFCLVIDDMPRSPEAFWHAWVRTSCLIFIVLAGLFTFYWFGPFPHVEVGGFVLHP